MLPVLPHWYSTGTFNEATALRDQTSERPLLHHYTFPRPHHVTQAQTPYSTLKVPIIIMYL